ncbi:MAG: Uma2 family endonuclease [Thermomicrobiales bacterium]
MADLTMTVPVEQELRLKMSYEEFLALPGDGRQMEWVDGEAIVFMPPSIRHQLLSGFLFSLLNIFAGLFNLGRVIASPVEMRTRPDGPAREPDLLFVAREHLNRLTEQRLAGPADLVVEIVSPESVGRDRREKFVEYAEAGIPEYWWVDPRPRHRRFEPFTLNEAGNYEPIQPDEQGRYHSRILPGFWIDPTWFWQDPLPEPLPLLIKIAPSAIERLMRGLE